MTRITVTVAAALWILAWVRVGVQVATEPAPSHAVHYVGLHAEPNDGRMPHCHGPILAEGDALWRSCEYRLDFGEPPGGGLVRFDLAARTARMDWRLGDDPSGAELEAAALVSDGLLVLTRRGHRLLHLGFEGGVQARGTVDLPLVALHPDAVVVDRAIEVSRAEPEVRPFDGPALALPVLNCEPTEVCAARGAWRDDGGWIVWYTRMRPDARQVEILRARPGGVPVVVQRLPYAAEDGRVLAPLDMAPAGRLVRFPSDGPMARLEGDTWRPALPPPDEHGLPASPDLDVGADQTYALLPGGGLRWHAPLYAPFFPRDFTQRFRLLDDRWRVLRLEDDRLTIDGRPLDADPRWLSSDSALAPASGGGQWLMGPFGTHVHLDGDLRRTDVPGLAARVWAVVGRFDRLRVYNDLYLDFAPLKIAGYLLVLFGFPLALLVGLVRRRRALLVACGAYVVLACANAWWFWLLTRHV